MGNTVFRTGWHISEAWCLTRDINGLHSPWGNESRLILIQLEPQALSLCKPSSPPVTSFSPEVVCTLCWMLNKGTGSPPCGISPSELGNADTYRPRNTSGRETWKSRNKDRNTNLGTKAFRDAGWRQLRNSAFGLIVLQSTKCIERVNSDTHSCLPRGATYSEEWHQSAWKIDGLACISSRCVTLKISFSKKIMFQELFKFWKEEMIKTSIRLNSF